MILYVSPAHALKDEMKADSICVLFMSEEGDRIGAETGKRGMEGFSGSVSLHGSYFRRILVRSVFLWDLYAFHGVRLSLSCPYGGIHFRRFAGVRRSGNAYESVCPAGCLCYGADGAVPPFIYGISMLEKYENMGWKKPFLMFWMCDETFALNYTATVPRDVDRGWFMLWVSFLNYFYWVSGATVGGLLGSLAAFDTKGLSFVMTALFVVIFLEQFLREKKHYTAMIGGVSAVGCLAVFGAESFILPAMGLILAAITLLRKPIEKAGGFL